MTTAHRATFHAAVGGKEQGGGRYIAGVSRVHVHDLAGQMSIKSRFCAGNRILTTAASPRPPAPPRRAGYRARARPRSSRART